MYEKHDNSSNTQSSPDKLRQRHRWVPSSGLFPCCFQNINTQRQILTETKKGSYVLKTSIKKEYTVLQHKRCITLAQQLGTLWFGILISCTNNSVFFSVAVPFDLAGSMLFNPQPSLTKQLR